MAILERKAGQFFLGVVFGMVAGLGAVFGIIGVMAAAGVVLVLGFSMPPWAALSGALIALGAEWLLLTLNSTLACSKTPGQCGQPEFLPFVAFAVVMFGAGLLFGALTLRSNVRRAP